MRIRWIQQTTRKNNGKSSESVTITAGITALFRAVNVHIDQPPLTHLPALLEVAQKAVASTKITVATRMALYERTKALCDGLRKRTHPQGSSQYDLCMGVFTLLEVSSGSGSEALRLKRAEAAEMVIQSLNSGLFGVLSEGTLDCKNKMKDIVEEGKRNERSPIVRAVLDRALKELM